MNNRVEFTESQNSEFSCLNNPFTRTSPEYQKFSGDSQGFSPLTPHFWGCLLSTTQVSNMRAWALLKFLPCKGI